uniref:Uncharacterized protein n=1 Tax=Oryza meridionalis TaxID=40149 RepID=A0A0E0CAZ5_9ORYZ
MPRLRALVLVRPANACRIAAGALVLLAVHCTAAVNHARRIGNQKTRTPTLPRCPHAYAIHSAVGGLSSVIVDGIPPIRRVWFMLRAAAAAAAASVLRQFNTMPDLCNVQRAYEQIQCYVV